MSDGNENMALIDFISLILFAKLLYYFLLLYYRNYYATPIIIVMKWKLISSKG